MGIGQWALGNGHARIKKAAVSNARTIGGFFPCPMTAGARSVGPTPSPLASPLGRRPHCLPHAPCPMPHYQFPTYVNKITLNIKLLVTEMRYECNPCRYDSSLQPYKLRQKPDGRVTIVRD
jgi:hypothetical protein